MSYEFAGSLHNNLDDAEMANVKTFLLAGGRVENLDIDSIFENIHAVAEEMTKTWTNVEEEAYTLEGAREAIADALLEIIAENVNTYLWQSKNIMDLRSRLFRLEKNPFYDKNRHKEVDYSDLPVFSDNEPSDTQGILSYSDSFLLTSDLMIVSR